MALVSPSLSPANALNYGATPPAFSRSSSDPPPAQIRALPTIPTGGARRQGSQQSLGASGGTNPAAQQARPPPASAVGRSPSAPPFVELTSSRSVSPLPPAATTTRSTTPSRSTSTPSPSPHQHHQHTLSASSSASSSAGSLPRLPPVHLVQGPNSAPPVPNGLVGVQQYPQHHQQQHHHQHPSFVGHHQAFPSFGGGGVAAAGPHAFPHPQYPFIPSPHPQAGGVGAALGYQPGPYSPGFNAPSAAGSSPASVAESQHQARLVQQAHLQQQQWQMEMMRNQQQQHQQGQAFDWQQQQQGQARRRATSGPAPPSHSPTYYTSPLPYPPSPSPTLHTKYLPNVGGPPALPPGAMLPQFGHGYPTPPGSVEGRENSREGYHPYRRGGAKGDNDASQRSTSHPRPPTSSAMTHNPSASSSSSHHHRNESSSSALAAHNFPPLLGKPSPSPVASSSSSSSAFTGASSTKQGNSSTTSLGSSNGTGGRTPPSARSTPPSATVPLPPVSRTRTESQQSTNTTSSSRDAHSRQYSSSSGSSSRRGESFDSARSATPVQGLNNKKPSPLSRQYQQAASVVSHGSSSRPSSELERPGTPGTLRAGREEEEEEDSDDTAGATIAPNSVGALKGVGVGAQSKEKDRKGMKSRFKKAFGGSSTPALSENELDGRGPKAVVMERRRVDSSSSTDSGAITGHPRLASSSASVFAPTSSAASTSGSTRPPPSTSGRRFGLLNGKFNGSSDNLSISSTVSSASVMIRKLGNMGKMARRNSLMSLTKAFKSKDKEEDPSAPTKEELKQLKKDKKKGTLAATSVSHATAEVESPSRVNGMSPAAALAKKHQQQYAEQEAAVAAATAQAAAEAEKQRNAGRSFTVHARGESDGASIRSGKMLDGGKKEEKKGKGKGGRKWGFGGSKKEGGGATGDDASSIADGSSIREGGAAYSRSNSVAGYYEDDGLAPGVEVLAQPAYAAYGASYQEGEVAADSVGEEDYEPSVVENNHRKDYRGVRGILKGAGSYRQEDYALPKPAFPRTRAASFDAPQQQARPGSPGNAALVNVIPSEAQVDGLVPSATSSRSDTQPPSPNTTPLDRVPPPPSANPASSNPNAGPYSHPQMNVSAPTLSHFGNKLHPIRSASAPGGSGRRIAFAQNLSVHTTWPANVYDRRAEPATCNRLTPTLAQQIKEELNSFKMEEMDVHPSSRQLTHFFV